MEELEADVFQISMTQSRIKISEPVHIAFFVYQRAKILLLDFYYDFLVSLIKPENFSLVFIDTDSFYLGLAETDFNSVAFKLNREDRRNFFEKRDKYLMPEACPNCKPRYINEMVNNDKKWVARKCCIKFQKHQQREPGLFKIEFQGTGVISLSPKSYFCLGERKKVGAKGVSQKHKLNWGVYSNVLTKKSQHEVTNHSFRYHDNEQRTYLQKKIGLSPVYVKRDVQEDGISTCTLNI